METIKLHVLGHLHEYRAKTVNGFPVLLGPGVSLIGMDLSGENLSGLDLSNADLTDANLSFTRCHRTNFTNSSFAGTQCVGMDAREAVLKGVITDSETSWMWADLRGAEYDDRLVAGYYFSDDVKPEYLARIGISPLNDDPLPPVGLVPIELADASPAQLSDTDCARFEPEASLAPDVLELDEMAPRAEVAAAHEV